MSKTLYSPKVLVIPRKQWLSPDIAEKLLTGMLSLSADSSVGSDVAWESRGTVIDPRVRHIFS